MTQDFKFADYLVMVGSIAETKEFKVVECQKYKQYYPPYIKYCIDHLIPVEIIRF